MYDLKPAKKVLVEAGDLYTGLIASSSELLFAEVYTSYLNPNLAKGWKCHTRIYTSIFVPAGNVNFLIQKDGIQDCFSLGHEVDQHYVVTIPPGSAFAMCSPKDTSLVVIALSNLHDPCECHTSPLSPQDLSLLQSAKLPCPYFVENN